MFKSTSIVELDPTRSYLSLEDKVTIIQQLQAMQIADKNHNLSSYPVPRYGELIAALLDSGITDMAIQKDFIAKLS